MAIVLAEEARSTIPRWPPRTSGVAQLHSHYRVLSAVPASVRATISEGESVVDQGVDRIVDRIAH